MVSMINTDDCLLWARYTNKKDYGVLQVKINGKWTMSHAHRQLYLALVGDIPEGYHVDHLCRTPRCINIEHLEAVTPQENNRRRIFTKRVITHCKYGHEFTGNNIYYRKNGKRWCRICKNAYFRKYWAKRKAN